MAPGILVAWPGIEPVPPLLEAQSLTHGPPGRPFFLFFWFYLYEMIDYNQTYCGNIS